MYETKPIHISLTLAEANLIKIKLERTIIGDRADLEERIHSVHILDELNEKIFEELEPKEANTEDDVSFGNDTEVESDGV